MLTHAAQGGRTLVVSGHPGELAVVDMGGRSYVEIEALASVVNGSLSFMGNQMTLTLPAAANAPGPVSTVSPPAASGFSKEFLRAGIEEMSVIREWRSALTNAVQRGFLITADWLDGFGTRAQQSLRLTSLAAATDSDRAAFQLLTNEFNNMKQLSDRFLQTSKSMTYISPDSLNGDPLYERILTCARSLAAMAASGQFSDDGSCH